MLTAIQSNSNLAMPLPYVRGGIGVPKINGISRFTAVFLCKNSQHHIYMSSWVEQSKDWLGSLIPVRQFYPVRLHNWRYVVGFKTLSTEAIMPKFNAQEPTKTNTPTLNVRLKSLFTLLSANREIIAEHLTFDQAKPLSEHINGSVIKFDRMGGVL